MHWVISFGSKQRPIISVRVPLGRHPPIRTVVVAIIHTLFAVYTDSIFHVSLYFLALFPFFMNAILFPRGSIWSSRSHSLSAINCFIRPLRCQHLNVWSFDLLQRFCVALLELSIQTSFHIAAICQIKKCVFSQYRHGQNKLLTKYLYMHIFVRCTLAMGVCVFK